MGFNNDGAEAVAARLAKRGRPAGGPVLGVNIGKTKVVPEDDEAAVLADYTKSARLLAPHADYLVVNVSSPNTPGLRSLQAVERLGPLLDAVRRVADVPLLVKIAPDLADDDVVDVAELALSQGLDGIIATNTTISRDGLRTPGGRGRGDRRRRTLRGARRRALARGAAPAQEDRRRRPHPGLGRRHLHAPRTPATASMPAPRSSRPTPGSCTAARGGRDGWSPPSPDRVTDGPPRVHGGHMLRLVGLLGGLSVAMDMGTGAPLEESLRRCVVAGRLADALGCGAEERRDALYSALLEHLGCTAYTHELAAVFGDDIAAVRAGFLADPTDPRDLVRTLARLLAEGSGRSRVRTATAALVSGRRVDAEAPVATCEVARAAALRLGLPESVQDCLGHVTAMWDGSGHPAVGGDQVPVGARLMHVASVATTFTLLAGPERALREVRRRAGTQLDPRMAALVTPEVLEDLADLDAYATVLETEPDPVRLVADEDVVPVARTFGDLADLKSPWLHGHSAAVADLPRGRGSSWAWRARRSTRSGWPGTSTTWVGSGCPAGSGTRRSR